MDEQIQNKWDDFNTYYFGATLALCVAGLEWFHRLLKEPRRLARRYLIQGVPFAVTLFRTAALERFSAQKNLRKP